MAYDQKHHVFVEILEKLLLPDGEAYKVMFPSGVSGLIWAKDVMFI